LTPTLEVLLVHLLTADVDEGDFVHVWDWVVHVVVAVLEPNRVAAAEICRKYGKGKFYV